MPIFNKLSLAQQVEQALRTEITEGRVRPGQRISINDYQESWSISATPFRDAVRTLEMQGFLTIEPRKSVHVAPMTAQTFREIFDIRIALECMAIELATSWVPQDIANAALAICREAALRLKAGDMDFVRENDRIVHDLAMEHCGNSRLQRLLGDQLDLVRWAQNTIIQDMPSSYEMAVPEHIRILDAVCGRDPALASREMRIHLEGARGRHDAWLVSNSR